MTPADYSFSRDAVSEMLRRIGREQKVAPAAFDQQLARQLQRELDARSEAIKRLRQRTRTAEERCYASSTVYGSAFISKGLELITEQISNQLHVINLGRASDKADAILSIQSCEPCVLALITAKGVLDILGMRRIEDLTYKAATTHIRKFGLSSNDVRSIL